MTSEPTNHLSEFAANAGSGSGELKAAQESLNFVLPEDYRVFMKARNGGEGFIGENYVIIWKLGELAEFNREYEVNKYAPGLVLFGSNGGGEGFGFDTRTQNSIVMVPFIGMGLSVAEEIARSFDLFICALAERASDELF